MSSNTVIDNFLITASNQGAKSLLYVINNPNLNWNAIRVSNPLITECIKLIIEKHVKELPNISNWTEMANYLRSLDDIIDVRTKENSADDIIILYQQLKGDYDLLQQKYERLQKKLKDYNEIRIEYENLLQYKQQKEEEDEELANQIKTEGEVRDTIFLKAKEQIDRLLKENNSLKIQNSKLQDENEDLQEQIACQSIKRNCNIRPSKASLAFNQNINKGLSLASGKMLSAPSSISSKLSIDYKPMISDVTTPSITAIPERPIILANTVYTLIVGQNSFTFTFNPNIMGEKFFFTYNFKGWNQNNNIVIIQGVDIKQYLQNREDFDKEFLDTYKEKTQELANQGKDMSSYANLGAAALFSYKFIIDSLENENKLNNFEAAVRQIQGQL